LYSAPGKVYGTLIIERVREITEIQIRDQQGGLRKGRGCVDQVFMLKSVWEKYLGKKKKCLVHLLTCRKPDSVDIQGMWEV
jgi:hypothetical protein